MALMDTGLLGSVAIKDDCDEFRRGGGTSCSSRHACVRGLREGPPEHRGPVQEASDEQEPAFNQGGQMQFGFGLKEVDLEGRRSSLTGTRRPRRMAGTAKSRELDGAGGGGSAGVGEAPDAGGQLEGRGLGLGRGGRARGRGFGPAQK